MKAHGTGNDFVVLPDLRDLMTLDAAFTRAVCDRHHGLGGDGAIRLAPPRPGVDADVFMDYRNADGSLAEMCGNGVRCVAKIALDRGLVDGDRVRVDSRAGVRTVVVVDRDPGGAVARVRVDMGPAELGDDVAVDVSPLRVMEVVGDEMPGAGMMAATADYREVKCTTLSMGNPHAVVVVDDLARAPVTTWGPTIGADPAFPHGTNVEFITVPRADTVQGRIWERGVGETASSGTGACAMGVAAHRLGLSGRHVTVRLPGGELDVEWTATGVSVTGPAEIVATGSLEAGWLAARGLPAPPSDQSTGDTTRLR